MKNPAVDEFLENAKKWQQELTLLRSIVLDCALTEELKWKQPCYTFQNKNVLIIGGFSRFLQHQQIIIARIAQCFSTQDLYHVFYFGKNIPNELGGE